MSIQNDIDEFIDVFDDHQPSTGLVCSGAAAAAAPAAVALAAVRAAAAVEGGRERGKENFHVSYAKIDVAYWATSQRQQQNEITTRIFSTLLRWRQLVSRALWLCEASQSRFLNGTVRLQLQLQLQLDVYVNSSELLYKTPHSRQLPEH